MTEQKKTPVPLKADMFTVVYHLHGGAYRSAEPTRRKPDIEKMRVPADAVSFSVIAADPMERAITDNQRDAMREFWPDDAFLYTTTYFPDAVVIDFDRAQHLLKHDTAAVERLTEKAKKEIKFAAAVFGRDATRQPNELQYIHVPRTNEVHVFRENYAVLQRSDTNRPVPRWKKIIAAVGE